MASVKVRNNAVAYTRGVKAGRGLTKTKCPYGETKVEMAIWFWRGYRDGRDDTVDENMNLANLTKEEESDD